MTPELDPAAIADFDQTWAAVNHQLDALLQYLRESFAEYSPSEEPYVAAAFAINLPAQVHPHDVAALLAAAIYRLTRDPS